MQVTNRVVLQMDQTAPAHREILRTITQCGEDPNLDRPLDLRALSDHSQTPAARTQPLRHDTNSQRHFVRKNADFTGFFAYQPLHRVGHFLQPARFIQLMTGK